MIEGIDDSLGRILVQLEKLGVAENTLILFLGDNGSDAPFGDAKGHTSSAPLRGKKGTHYEGGMRVPFIAAWAKPAKQTTLQMRYPIQQNVIHDSTFASILDLFPSLLQLASVQLPKGHHVDGGSLWETFAGKQPVNPQTFLIHFPHSHRSSYFTSCQDGY